MSSKIYLLQPDKSLRPMEEAAYDSEDLLQELLEQHPDLLAGDLMNEAEPRRWLLVSREFGVPREEGGGDWWAVDHLFLDQDAVPSLIEVKRSSDSRIRREVVGQMLDYAANAVVYWPVEKIRARFEAGSEQADVLLGQLLDTGSSDQEAFEDFWARVKTNLQAGRVRLVFVADEIPPELRRIVEFLNTQMDPAEVYAVEIRQFVGEERKALVPRLVGHTSAAETRKGTRSKFKWTRETFFEELEKGQGKEIAAVASDILDWIEPKMTRVWWGEGSTMGSAVPIIDLSGGRAKGGQNVHFFAMWTNGSVEMYFQWLKSKPGFEPDEKRQELLRRVNEAPGIELPGDSIARRPWIQMEALANPKAMGVFKRAIGWAIQEVKAAAGVGGG